MIGNVFTVLNTKTLQIKLVSKIVTLKNVCIKAFLNLLKKDCTIFLWQAFYLPLYIQWKKVLKEKKWTIEETKRFPEVITFYTSFSTKTTLSLTLVNVKKWVYFRLKFSTSHLEQVTTLFPENYPIKRNFATLSWRGRNT